jgi:16S rRNA (guanine(966)-N(2))-methyltransferase RsmD
MRIIRGDYKGIRLLSPKGNKIRPTTDKTKERLFNILQNRIIFDEAIVLDMFCGSGALGIEACSMGAKQVTFVDNDNSSIILTQSNLSKIQSSAKTMCCDYKVAIKNFAKNLNKFNLILLDPPYNREIEDKVLQQIVLQQILENDGIIALECSSDTNLTDICIKLELTLQVYYCGKTNLNIITKE